MEFQLTICVLTKKKIWPYAGLFAMALTNSQTEKEKQERYSLVTMGNGIKIKGFLLCKHGCKVKFLHPSNGL